MVINDLNLDFEKINPISGRSLDKLFGRLTPVFYGKSVYYYTDVKALFNGIIIDNPKEKGEDICLWATKWSHLNDPTEIKSGLDLIKNGVPNDVLHNFERMVERNHSISFSLQKDFLPMWSMYGHYGSGVMLEFDAEKLFNKYNYRFLRCLYKDTEMFDTIAENLFGITYIEEKSSLNKEELIYILAMHSSLFFSIVKNKYYQYEDEVRIVGIGNPLGLDAGSCIESYRECNGVPIPYVKEYFPKDFLKSVCLGPSTADKNLSKQTIEKYLMSHNINVKVWCSEIPYRKF